MFDLSGRKALVTGASGSIGGGIARALHQQGATVGISGTRREALETLAAELGERVHVLPCDLADGAAVDALIPAAEAAMGDLDILVNNAGMTRDTLFVRLTDEDWNRVIAVNLTAAFKLTRAVLMGMMRRRFGRIISVSSVVAVTGNAGQGNYAASKAGLIGMTKAVGKECAKYDIAINAITPATAKTRILEELKPEFIDYMLSRIPRGRFLEVEEAANMVSWLVSKENSFTTASVFDLSGGRATY